MKKIIIIALIVILVVLFGTFPLSLLGKLFNWISIGFNWLAGILNIFGWNGII